VRIFLHLRIITIFISVFYLTGEARAASKPHVITFGKWTMVKYMRGQDENKSSDMKVRPLYVDGRIKEFVFGMPHDVTDRLFVVRRAFRLNDALPDETGTAPRWKWQLGGWLLVDHVSGHVSQLALPDFDLNKSIVSWYRDYAAYCGISDDGKKLYALVEQLGRRKPILKKAIRENGGDDLGKSECLAGWQRQPARVTFTISSGQNRNPDKDHNDANPDKDKDEKFTYAVRGSTADILTQENDDGSDTE
jgi:hypothetical protein